jgi:tRNA-dihydrouridine synthase A
MSKGFHISVAPMMDWTDRHCRYFHRLLSPNAVLYTEMVTTGALIHGDAERYLRFNAQEHPVALQLGGSDPADLATSAKMGEDHGYDEINLNCGCPSDRVQRGKIGAILMEEPELVAESVAAMRAAVDIPVTIKCRIAIDDYEEEPFLDRFVQTVAASGCDTFIIHARKAWLQGLSPKENRDVPPLNYDLVKEMKARYPQLNIIINGGINSVEQIQSLLPRHPVGMADQSEGHLHKRDPEKDGSKAADNAGFPPFKAAYPTRGNNDILLDGAMIGRKAYQDPYFLTELEADIFGNTAPISRETAILQMIPYIEQQAKDHGTPLKSITRHMLGLFNGIPGAKRWKRILSEEAHKPETTPEILKTAMEAAFECDLKVAAE